MIWGVQRLSGRPRQSVPVLIMMRVDSSCGVEEKSAEKIIMSNLYVLRSEKLKNYQNISMCVLGGKRESRKIG